MNDFLDNSNKFALYLFETYLRELPVLQTFSVVIIGTLLFFVVLMTVKANTIGGKKDKFIDKWNLADMSKVKIVRAWNEIASEINSGESVKMKKAINDADKILDEVLKNNGYFGNTMDERLNRVDEDRLPNLKEVWQAHKVSVRIKKEPALILTQQEAKNIIGIYRKAFQELGLFN